MGIAAQWGTFVHSWLETGQIPNGKEGDGLRKRIEASQISRHTLWPLDGEFEVTLALRLSDFKCVRYPGVALPPGRTLKEDREAWKMAFDDDWIVGSADYGNEIMDGPWVDDLKTGRYAHWKDFAAQQSFYSLAYSLYRYNDIRDTRSTVTQWTRYPIGNKPVRKGCVLTAQDLEAFGSKLRTLQKRVRRLREAAQDIQHGTLFRGEHCYFCPSKNNCVEYNKE